MKIVCIGRNYRAHARELDNSLPTEPLFFLKPRTALLNSGASLSYPDFTRSLHYEVELVLEINRTGRKIQRTNAKDHYGRIGLGLDLTARDIQQQEKAAGHPWTRSKAFDGAAPIGEAFHPVERLPEDIHFQLKKNDQLVQDGNSRLMIFPFDELVAYVSRFMTLEKGDLIFTGTPEGVGELEQGDVLEGSLEGRKVLETSIT